MKQAAARRPQRPPAAQSESGAAAAARDVAVLDVSGELSEELERALQQHNASSAQPPINLRQYAVDDDSLADLTHTLSELIRAGTLDACLVLLVDVPLTRSTCFLYTRNASDRDLVSAMRAVVKDAIAYRRLRAHGVSSELIAELRRGVPLEHVPLQPEAKKVRPEAGRQRTGPLSETRAYGMMTAFFFLFLMFFSIVSTGQMLLTSLIEERNSRVIEVLLSAVSPFQLMAGKILGLAAVGLTLAAICGSTLAGAAASQGVLRAASLKGFGLFLPYYVLGFLLISSLYAAVGATCNTLKEAQAMMIPLMLVVALPMMGWMYIAQNPNGWPAISLSFFPPTAPMVMMLRLAVAPHVPLSQVVVSLVLLGASAPLAMWASARVFRTGILMYGKPPSLREMLRWVRSR
jgi:ABC-2 type transport system permease protein